MKRVLVNLALCWLLFCDASYAVDTYFPGEGPPTSVDVETQPSQYYPPQQAQPNPEEEPYHNPTQPINPNATIANPETQP